jgi:hypothetical protein
VPLDLVHHVRFAFPAALYQFAQFRELGAFASLALNFFCSSGVKSLVLPEKMSFMKLPLF